jgi:hypothetical protein
MTFRTEQLVEAALMRLRTNQEPKCEFDERRHCTFIFEDVTEADVSFATSDALVKARAFNYALVQVKTAMYSKKNG